MLLHRVVWKVNEKFDGIFNSYVPYVKKNFPPHVVVIFDGYQNNPNSTKNVERARRAHMNTCADIIFDENLYATVKQESLLSNKDNKDRFVKQLKKYFIKANITVEQADDDADLLIVQIR